MLIWRTMWRDRIKCGMGWAACLFCVVAFLPFVAYLHVSSWIDRIKEKLK